MKKSISKFNHLYLSTEEARNVTGGYANFCEWYLGLCNGDESSSDIKKGLKEMMKFDALHDITTADQGVLNAAYLKFKKYL